MKKEKQYLTTAKKREYQKRKYEKRKRELRCLRCGRSRYSVVLGEDYKYCQSCRKYHENYRRSKGVQVGRQLTPKRFCKALGICSTCQQSPVSERRKVNDKPYRTCESCLERARGYHHA